MILAYKRLQHRLSTGKEKTWPHLPLDQPRSPSCLDPFKSRTKLTIVYVHNLHIVLNRCVYPVNIELVDMHRKSLVRLWGNRCGKIGDHDLAGTRYGFLA
jgi:hypothetical protein